MVVKTRSYYYSKEEQQEQEQARESSSSCSADSINITTSVAGGGGRRVRITTPSFREASIRTYKVYTPSIKPKQRRNNKEREAAKAVKAAEAMEAVEAEAIEALLALQQDDELECGSGGGMSSGLESSVKHTCMNPMNPITTYMYRISVYNLDRTAHIKTAYILYDPKSRLYYVHTIISNQIDHHHDPHAVVVEEDEPIAAAAAWALPEPKNTLQMKFTAFVGETISNYVMSLIIPSKEYDYYIQDDIIGLVSSNSDTHTTAATFGEESSFYDIERLLYDQSSTLTTNGFKAFMLLPSRQFWYTSYYYSASGAVSDNRYTYHTMDSVLLILGQSQ